MMPRSATAHDAPICHSKSLPFVRSTLLLLQSQMPMVEHIRAAPLPEVDELPRDIILTVQEMAWMSRTTRVRMGIEEDEEILQREGGDDDSAATGLASKMKQKSSHMAELERNPLAIL